MALRPLRQIPGGMHGLAELAILKRKGAEVEGVPSLEASEVSCTIAVDEVYLCCRSVGLKAILQCSRRAPFLLSRVPST